ncbi:MAG: hypothetical protein F6K42_13940 [Leptolyngbya sp. SIO1D8]|nr:hypothetical protein [Leptolyngbya sp. SIO1D8]
MKIRNQGVLSIPGRGIGNTDIKQPPSDSMWQSVINYFYSLWTYRDLSPDLGIQRQVNAKLKDRPRLSLEAWSNLFNQMEGCSSSISQPLLAFIYRKLQDYSGLDIGRVRATDRLIEDLQFPLVCWFDWPNQLCEDFFEMFQIDISDEFDASLLETLGDLVCFLNRRLKSIDSLSSG